MSGGSKADGGSRAILAPLLAIAGAMVSVQVGAAFAKRLFPVVGPEGTVALRVSLAALMLLVIVRPWRRWPPRGTRLPLAGFGVILGSMNLLFYMSLSRIPLGIAVGLEFTGPLAVAMLSSRRWQDLLWVALAAAGVALLLPLDHGAARLDPAGVVLALGAGVCWALYILLGKRVGAGGGPQAVTWGTLVAAMIVVPVGLAHAGLSLFAPPVLLAGAAVALLSSAVPYSLEMIALTRIPTRVFGTLMSAEPALGALMGFLVLGEHLTLRQDAAIAAIIAASLGAALTLRDASTPPQPPV